MSATEKPMPQDFLRLCLERRVKVQVADNRELIGVLHGYDEHCNIVVGEANETFLVETEKGDVLRQTRVMDLLFVRGDRVITISPVQ